MESQEDETCFLLRILSPATPASPSPMEGVASPSVLLTTSQSFHLDLPSRPESSGTFSSGDATPTCHLLSGSSSSYFDSTSSNFIILRPSSVALDALRECFAVASFQSTRRTPTFLRSSFCQRFSAQPTLCTEFRVITCKFNASKRNGAPRGVGG